MRGDVLHLLGSDGDRLGSGEFGFVTNCGVHAGAERDGTDRVPANGLDAQVPFHALSDSGDEGGASGEEDAGQVLGLKFGVVERRVDGQLGLGDQRGDGFVEFVARDLGPDDAAVLRLHGDRHAFAGGEGQLGLLHLPARELDFAHCLLALEFATDELRVFLADKPD